MKNKVIKFLRELMHTVCIFIFLALLILTPIILFIHHQLFYLPPSQVLIANYQVNQDAFQELADYYLEKCKSDYIWEEDLAPYVKKLFSQTNTRDSVHPTNNCTQVMIRTASKGFIWTSAETVGYLYSPNKIPTSYCAHYLAKISNPQEFGLVKDIYTFDQNCYKDDFTYTTYQQIDTDWYIFYEFIPG